MNETELNLLLELLCRLAVEKSSEERENIKTVQMIALKQRDGKEVYETS